MAKPYPFLVAKWLFLTSTISCLLANALVPSKSNAFYRSAAQLRSRATTITTTRRPRRSTLTMYFDDVSPHIRWDPENEDQNESPMKHDGFLPSPQMPFSSSSSANSSSSPLDRAKIRAQEQQKRLQDDKQAMIRKFLTGYNARTAAELKNKDIKRQTKFWCQESGVVGNGNSYNYFGDDVLYDDVLGTSISNATTLIGCLTDMWNFVKNDIIDAFTETEFKTTQHKWTLKRKNDKYNKKPLQGSSHVFFCIFPHCADAYDYKTFTMLVAALEFCKDLCVYMGKEFSVTLFHPKFKNSPSLLSPERHSPFPTIALQFGPAYKAERTEGQASIFTTRSSRRQSTDEKASKENAKGKAQKLPPQQLPPFKENKISNNGPIRIHNGAPFGDKSQSPPSASDEAEEETELEHLIERKISDLDGAKASLEVLYNSAAASGQFDSVWTHDDVVIDEHDPVHDDDEPTIGDKVSNDEPPQLDTSMLMDQFASLSSNQNLTSEDIPASSSDPIVKRFNEERKRRRRDVPDRRVKDYLTEWVQTAKIRSDGTQNPALLYWDTAPKESGWTICQDKTAEKAYSAIWTTIRELYEAGDTEAPASVDTAQQPRPPHASKKDYDRDEDLKRKGRKFNLGDWLAGLSSENGQVQRSDMQTSNSMIPPTAIRSRVFVTTKFQPYNAQSFKRFAITVNAALKRFSDNRMWIEVFHPEYVGAKSFQNDSRRAPYPMLLICYHAKPSKK